MTSTLLYKDDRICAVIKPPGVFVHPSALDRNVTDCRTELEAELGYRVHNVHRIDRPSSGVVLFALDELGAADLSAQFRNRETVKRYLAIVRGHILDQIIIDSPLPGRRKGIMLDAKTTIEPLSSSVVPEPVGKFDEGWFSLVSAKIETGRPHQIRKHLRKINHPIIGDTEHGDSAQNRYIWNNTGFRGLALLAYSLVVRHPQSHGRIEFCSGLNSWWVGLLNSLRLELPFFIETKAFIRGTDGNKTIYGK